MQQENQEISQLNEIDTIPEQENNNLLCDENCDPFFIKTDSYGYCKKCFKNLGYVRK